MTTCVPTKNRFLAEARKYCQPYLTSVASVGVLLEISVKKISGRANQMKV
jgi:hypothetical protein